jgi:hypothetical protein
MALSRTVILSIIEVTTPLSSSSSGTSMSGCVGKVSGVIGAALSTLDTEDVRERYGSSLPLGIPKWAGVVINTREFDPSLA